MASRLLWKWSGFANRWIDNGYWNFVSYNGCGRFECFTVFLRYSSPYIPMYSLLKLCKGTGIVLMGSAGCPYTVSVDNIPVELGNPPSGALFSDTTSLSASIHTISLFPQPSQGQSLNLTGVQVIAPATSKYVTTVFAPKVSYRLCYLRPSLTLIDNQDITRVAYQGTWINSTNPQIPNATSPQPYFMTNGAGASASLNFRGRAVSVSGATDSGSGIYQVVRKRGAVFSWFTID